MVLQCAEVVVIVETVLAFTIQWGFDRHSFGRPLASYQVLKHKYADLKIWFEAWRATTAAGGGEVAAGSRGADMAVSVAKSYVGEHAPGMLQDCVQLHGGIGVTWEHDLHLFLRRVTLYRSMFGTPEDHNLRVYALTEQLEPASCPKRHRWRPRPTSPSRISPRGHARGWQTTYRGSTPPACRSTIAAQGRH